MIKSRRVRVAGDVARMRRRGGVCRVLMGKPEEKRPLRRPRRGGRIILRWMFRKWDLGVWTGSIWLMSGTGGCYL
jgi:hypothetical protein